MGDVVFVTQGMTRGVYNVLHESSGELLGYKSRKKAGKAATSSVVTFSWKKALIDKHIKAAEQARAYEQARRCTAHTQFRRAQLTTPRLPTPQLTTPHAPAQHALARHASAHHAPAHHAPARHAPAYHAPARHAPALHHSS